jgi:valyl-tRNA synthetase
MQDSQQKAVVQNVLAFVLDATLRLLHPFVPFITEGIFEKLNEIVPQRSLKGLAQLRQADALIIADWPKGLNKFIEPTIEEEILIVQKVISVIREVRNKYTVPPHEMLFVWAKPQKQHVHIMERNADLIKQLAGVGEFKAGITIVKPPNAAVVIADATEVYVHNVINVEAERARLEKRKNEILAGVKSNEVKIANENFISRAKPEVVKQTKQRLAELSEQLNAIEKNLAELK